MRERESTRTYLKFAAIDARFRVTCRESLSFCGFSWSAAALHVGRQRCGPARLSASASSSSASLPLSQPCRPLPFRPFSSISGPCPLRLRGFRLGIRRSGLRCRHVPGHTRSRTSLNWWRRLDRRLVVCRPLRVPGGFASRRQPWPLLVHRLPCVRRPDRALLAQLPRGVVLGPAPALRVHPGIHFVLSAHMRNLSNAPTPPTSASSDASS